MSKDEPKRLETENRERVGYNFAMSYDLGSGRQIQLTGVLPVGVKLEAINAEFDKLRVALDRQQAKTAVYGIEAELENIEGTLAGLVEDLSNAEERFKGKAIPSNEQAAHNNIKVSLRNLTAKRDKVQKLLDRTKQEAE